MEESYLAGQFKLAYLRGKGRPFVPVLVPVDCVEAIDILVENRAATGVTADNRFMFASRGIHVWMLVKKINMGDVYI